MAAFSPGGDELTYWGLKKNNVMICRQYFSLCFLEKIPILLKISYESFLPEGPNERKQGISKGFDSCDQLSEFVYPVWPWPFTSDIDLVHGYHFLQWQLRLQISWWYGDRNIVNKSDVERRETLGHLRSINPNWIIPSIKSHLPSLVSVDLLLDHGRLAVLWIAAFSRHYSDSHSQHLQHSALLKDPWRAQYIKQFSTSQRSMTRSIYSNSQPLKDPWRTQYIKQFSTSQRSMTCSIYNALLNLSKIHDALNI